jgi:hypothetical protein
LVALGKKPHGLYRREQGGVTSRSTNSTESRRSVFRVAILSAFPEVDPPTRALFRLELMERRKATPFRSAMMPRGSESRWEKPRGAFAPVHPN